MGVFVGQLIVIRIKTIGDKRESESEAACKRFEKAMF